MLAIAHGRSMARITAPAVLGESALLAALAGVPARRPLTYRCAQYVLFMMLFREHIVSSEAALWTRAHPLDSSCAVAGRRSLQMWLRAAHPQNTSTAGSRESQDLYMS